jgi:hypothetical protein
MSTTVTSPLRDKFPPFQQACFPLHFTISTYFLIEYKSSFIVSLLFCVTHLLIICIHFIILIKSRSMVSERSTPCRLNAYPQRGQNTKSWVSSLFLLRTKSLACPSELSWKEKRNMMGHEILSKCFLRNPSCNRGTR